LKNSGVKSSGYLLEINLIGFHKAPIQLPTPLFPKSALKACREVATFHVFHCLLLSSAVQRNMTITWNTENDRKFLLLAVNAMGGKIQYNRAISATS